MEASTLYHYCYYFSNSDFKAEIKKSTWWDASNTLQAQSESEHLQITASCLSAVSSSVCSAHHHFSAFLSAEKERHLLANTASGNQHFYKPNKKSEIKGFKEHSEWLTASLVSVRKNKVRLIGTNNHNSSNWVRTHIQLRAPSILGGPWNPPLHSATPHDLAVLWKKRNIQEKKSSCSSK